MAPITTEGAEQDSQPASNRTGTGETAETGVEAQAVPDPKQEPGDNNESGARTDPNGAAEDGLSPGPGADKAAAPPTEKAEHGGGKLSEPGKSPVQGSLASSPDSAQEGSRVPKQEQRDGENVPSAARADRARPAGKTEPGSKRRASVELTPAEGEPLSRMDSEDRSVEVARTGETPRGSAACLRLASAS